MRYVNINNIKAGDTLAVTVFSDCNILLAANNELTERNIEHIKALGFKGLYIFEKSDSNIHKDLLSDDIRLQAMKNLKHINIDDCLYIANSITNSILENPEVLYEMMDICSYDTRTYIHCINVAILATMIGVDMKMTNHQLYELSQAALLHDIGKTAISENILNKKGKLTDEEFSIIKQHPVFGYNMLNHNENISENVRLGVKHHHENEDGSGYPSCLKGSQIPLIAKIIHVADVYDAMVSKRSYKSRINPADVMEYMMGNAGMFDLTVVKSLMHCAVLYPIGSEIQLSNGDTAFVVKNIRNYPQRPDIRLANGKYVSLMHTLNITVTALLT